MKEDRLWELVSLKLSGEATPEELNELEGLLASDTDLNIKVSQFSSLWRSQSVAPVPDTAQAFDRHLQRLSNHFAAPAMQYESTGNDLTLVSPGSGSRVRQIIRMGSIAASVIIVLSLLVYRFNSRQQATVPDAANVVTTKPGSKSKLSLPDGTQVWLNADSKITYNEEYNQKLRTVELNGEAYFDVVKDKTRPFIIHTKAISIKVLGTAFNVRSYQNEETSETSLVHGSVEVTLNGSPDKKIVLKPNEKLVVKDVNNNPQQQGNRKDETPLLKLTSLHYLKGDSSSVEVLWTRNKLAFEGETLENIAKTIERWYAVKVTINDERLKTEKYTSVFEDESLPEVMQALQLTGNFRYSINKKEVIIQPNN